MRFLIRFYDRCMAWTIPLQSIILLLIRWIWGGQLIWSGWEMLQDIQGTADYFQSLEIGRPLNVAWTVGTIEVVCGVLLVLGLLSRLAALPLVVIFIGAYVTAYSQAIWSLFTDFDNFTKQPPFLFLLASLTILAFGPGKFSLDYLVRSKTSK